MVTEQTLTEGPSNIYEAIHAIQTELRFIAKDGIADARQGGYPYLSTEAVRVNLKPLLDKYGVIVIPTVSSELVPRSEAGVNLFVVKVDASFKWVHAQSGSSERTNCSIYGGNPGTAQATGAAITYAWRYCASVLFSIPTGEPDPESQVVPGIVSFETAVETVPEDERDQFFVDAGELAGPDRVSMIEWMQSTSAYPGGPPLLSPTNQKAPMLSPSTLEAALAKLAEFRNPTEETNQNE